MVILKVLGYRYRCRRLVRLCRPKEGLSHNGDSKCNWNMCVKGNPVRLVDVWAIIRGNGGQILGGCIPPYPGICSPAIKGI